MLSRLLLCIFVMTLLVSYPRQLCVEREFEPRMHHKHVAVGMELMCYTAFVPDDYDPSRPWPLLLYWHGIDQAGVDGLEPLDQGLGPVLREFPELYPCIVGIPQLPLPYTGVGKSNLIYNAVMEDIQNEYKVDANRIYVTGASSGSSRALMYVAATPDVFAGLIPAAGPIPAAFASALTDIPILMFHGTHDEITPITGSRRLRDAIINAGGDAELREIQGGTHEIYFDVYSDPAMLAWLFSKSLPN